MAGKRVSLASLAATKVEATPGASRPDLVHVDPAVVAPTPLNPRHNFDQEELLELGENMRGGQLQPCVAVAKAAYLKLYPEHSDQLPEACRYVMAAGERRWRAAREVGLDALDVLVRHDLTESRVQFLTAVLSENVQRANFNPLEEASGLQAMLDLHGGNQTAAAKAMGKSKQWFNQRIGLLRLTDEMVQLVHQGKLTAFREMRRYAAMPPSQQYLSWKADQSQPRQVAPKAESGQPRPAAEQAPDPGHEPQAYTAVYAPPDADLGWDVPQQAPAVPLATKLPQVEPERQAGTALSVPDPRTDARGEDADVSFPDAEASGERRQVKMPWHDGVACAEIAITKMTPRERDRMVERLLQQQNVEQGEPSTPRTS